jgi:predicted small metal-binding protein
MKVLRCRDVGFDCERVIRAKTEREVLRQAAVHASGIHHIQVTPEMAQQVSGLIRDEAR